MVFSSHNKLKIQKILSFEDVMMTSSLMMSFWQRFWESFILTNFFCIFNCFSFLSMMVVRKNQKFTSVIFVSSHLVFFTLLISILINESITMFDYSIQSSQMNSSSVWCFLYINFWHFEHFVFNLLFSFSLSAL